MGKKPNLTIKPITTATKHFVITSNFSPDDEAVYLPLKQLEAQKGLYRFLACIFTFGLIVCLISGVAFGIRYSQCHYEACEAHLMALQIGAVPGAAVCLVLAASFWALFRRIDRSLQEQREALVVKMTELL